MIIKSNTLGKLQKIKNGNVFDTPLIFIREFLQNAQRSNAKNINFTVIDNIFSVVDDGCGCKNPENVFTLDLSSWESTNEGYGIGFWACLAIPDIKSITVKSFNWECTINTIKLFETGDLSIEKKEIPKINGFEVIIDSNFFDGQISDIEKYIYDVSKYLAFNTFLNELLIPKIDIFDSFVNKDFCKIYDNRLFKVKLSISKDYYTDITIFYDKRIVNSISCFDFVEGVVEIKKDKITLKEPDRTSYSRDEKYRAFTRKMNECIKDLFLSYISMYGIDDDEYQDAIGYYLDVKDYEKYLLFDEGMLELSCFDSKKKKNNDIEIVVENDEICEQVVIKKENFQKGNSEHHQNFSIKKDASAKIPAELFSPNNCFKEKMKKLKKSVWVRASEYQNFKDSISKAKYKGLNVIIAKNKLYANALDRYGITHISNLQDSLIETIIKTDICLKNSKEETFISLLAPICKKFNLSLDTFLIANLSIETSFIVDGNVQMKKKSCNKKNDIQIFALTDGINIYFDRTALKLNSFKIKPNNLGIWELKALMNVINTIAHELSHYLYNTTDNTVEQYNHEIKIQQEIISLYL